MDKHKLALQKISSAVAHFFKTSQPYRIQHGSTNSTRPRPSASSNFVDISALSNVLSVNPTTRTALVEPNVPMDALVTATLKSGLIPPVVMEFPGITTGGGYAGTAGESSSFKHGFFDDTIESVEMVLGNGEVVKASRTEREDLFRGAAGSVGTLGITTLIELRLIEAKKWVKTTYHRTHSVKEAIEKVQIETKVPENEYVDGILFSKDHGVVVTGRLTDEKPDDVQCQTFSGAWDPWFYLHAKDSTVALPSSTSADANTENPGTSTHYIPLAEYIFRYDRAGFWVAKAGFDYFHPVPFNRVTRWFLDDFMHTRMLYRALHGSGESARFVVQDLALPYSTAEEFIDYTADEFNIWPLWLCPLKQTPPPTFHPHTGEFEPTENGGAPKPKDMLNIGLWGWGPTSPTKFIIKNRDLEDKLVQLGGRKWLYAHTYYTESEFWKTYNNKEWYDSLREKYHAKHLPTVYDKVRVKNDVDVEKVVTDYRKMDASLVPSNWEHEEVLKKLSEEGWRGQVKRTRYLGGLWGIWKSIMSGDYWLHRQAGWKYKDGK